jgi:hypothetical protein
MAAVGVALVYRAENPMQVVRTTEMQGEVVTSSGTSAPSTLIASGSGQYWEISPAGDIWVDFGPTPVAAAGDKVKIWAGTTRHFQATALDKVAVIDA